MFSMPETLPRPLVALTIIVTIVAISLGIKDYVERQKKAEPPASTSTPTETHSNARTRPRKTTSANAIPARMSATEANAPATAEGAADDIERPVISDQSQAAHDEEVEAPMDRNGRVRNELDTTAVPASSACLPLPNLTKPGDVDTAYYENWAREYCGL
jgi:type IV secretory pathway VirB10-like protein